MTNLQLLSKEYLKEFKEKYPILEVLEIRYKTEDDEVDYYDWELIGDKISKISFNEQDKIHSEIDNAFDAIFWDIVKGVNTTINSYESEGKILLNFDEGTIYADNYEIVRTSEFNKEADYLGNIQEANQK